VSIVVGSLQQTSIATRRLTRVYRGALWWLLGFRGAPQTLINLLFKLYSDTKSTEGVLPSFGWRGARKG
jgi:hypothetical protein